MSSPTWPTKRRNPDPDNPVKWMFDGACIPTSGPQVPLDELFVEAGRSISEETYQTCVGCPVRIQCITYAYEEGLEFGYFGGISPSVRKKVPLDNLLRALAEGRVERGGKITE